MKTLPLETIADQVRELVEGAIPPPEVAEAILPRLNVAALRILARQWLIELAGEIERTNEYRTRRHASSMPPPAQDLRRHGTRRTYDQGCRCAGCVSWVKRSDEIGAASDKKLLSKMTAALDMFAADLKVQWTSELLASTFGTSRGRRVTWGEASIQDHEEHIAMDMAHMEGYIRDAAMHRQAINELNQRGTSCLNESVAVV